MTHTSSNMSVFVGVDGGGTKTKAVVINQQKQIIGQSLTGSTNQNSVGKDTAKQNLHTAISDAVKLAGLTLSDVAAVCLGMSGVDCPADEDLYRAWTSELLSLPKESLLVYNDSVAALSSGTLGKLRGMVVISGTGMIACGFRDGRVVRCGGWGCLLGDGGSGYAIASNMLRAVVRHHDGSGPATRMSAALLKHLNLNSIDDLIGWTYADTAWARFAALTPIVFEHYESDEVAAHIIDEAVAELVLSVRTAAAKLGFIPAQQPFGAACEQLPEFDLVLAGGILQSELIAPLFKRAVHRAMPNAQCLHPTVDAEMGSALLAWQSKQ